jgi:hypothetical protein
MVLCSRGVVGFASHRKSEAPAKNGELRHLQIAIYIIAGILFIIAVCVFISFWIDMSHRFKKYTGELEKKSDSHKK